MCPLLKKWKVSWVLVFHGIYKLTIMKKNRKLIIAILSSGLFCLISCNGNKSKTSSSSTDSAIAVIDSLKAIPKDTDDLKNIRICTELLKPVKKNPVFLNHIDTAIYYRDQIHNDTILRNHLKLKARISREQFQTESMQKLYNHANAAAIATNIWDHNILTVMFLDGNPEVERRVMITAKEWEKQCPIRFNFGVFANPDITISFQYDGSWSCIGNYSSENRPSMNFGWLYPNTPQEEYDRVVLHEFGHAIGLIHEHQNPLGNHIPWNPTKVYAYYKRPPNNWDKDAVDANIFHKYDLSELNATVFDPKSIMLYAIPASLTDGKYSTKANYQISPMDKQLVDSIYRSRIQ